MIVTYSFDVQCRLVAHWSVFLDVIVCNYDLLKCEREDRVMTIALYQMYVVLLICNNASRLHIN